MKRLVLILTSVLLSPVIQAQSIETLPPETVSRVYTNVAGDLAVCSAFFQIVSECLNNSGAEAGTKYKELSDRTLENAAVILLMSSTLTLESNGKAYDQAELWDKTQVSAFHNYEREYDLMIDEMVTCQNLSLLYTKHLDSCIAYYQDPDALQKKWVEKILSEERGE